MAARLRLLTIALAASITATASVASAQSKPTTPAPPQPRPPSARPAPRPAAPPAATRGFFTFGAGAQIGSADFSETHSEPLYGEQSTWTADYAVKTGLEFEIGGGWRLWRNLFAGATYTYFHDARAADVTSEVPHPFFFNQPRTVSGESLELSHDEHAAHISLYWIVPAGRRLEVGVFGGPSFIYVSRELVTDVEYTESYPYDTATFSAATAEDAHETAIGVHGGFDVMWRFNHQFGVGGTLRYSRASADLQTPAGGSMSFDAGGLQAAVALKVHILGKAPARAPTPAPPPRSPVPGTTPRSQVPVVGAIAVAVTTATAPVFLRPDATMTPLRQVPTGTRLRVLDQTGDWVHVEFDDRQYGRRVGYVQMAFVRIETGR